MLANLARSKRQWLSLSALTIRRQAPNVFSPSPTPVVVASLTRALATAKASKPKTAAASPKTKAAAPATARSPKGKTAAVEEPRRKSATSGTVGVKTPKGDVVAAEADDKKPKTKPKQKRALSAYQFFLKERMSDAKEQGGEKVGFAQIAEEWRSMSEKDKAKYIALSTEAKGPTQDVAEEATEKDDAKKMKLPTGYKIFQEKERKVAGRLTVTELSRRWKDLTDEEKKTYNDQAAALRKANELKKLSPEPKKQTVNDLPTQGVVQGVQSGHYASSEESVVAATASLRREEAKIAGEDSAKTLKTVVEKPADRGHGAPQVQNFDKQSQVDSQAVHSEEQEPVKGHYQSRPLGASVAPATSLHNEHLPPEQQAWTAANVASSVAEDLSTKNAQAHKQSAAAVKGVENVFKDLNLKSQEAAKRMNDIAHATIQKQHEEDQYKPGVVKVEKEPDMLRTEAPSQDVGKEANRDRSDSGVVTATEDDDKVAAARQQIVQELQPSPKEREETQDIQKAGGEHETQRDQTEAKASQSVHTAVEARHETTVQVAETVEEITVQLDRPSSGEVHNHQQGSREEQLGETKSDKSTDAASVLRAEGAKEESSQEESTKPDLDKGQDAEKVSKAEGSQEKGEEEEGKRKVEKLLRWPKFEL